MLTHKTTAQIHRETELSELHVFGMWEETGAPGGNPLSHECELHTDRKRAWIQRQDLLLRGHSANHRATVGAPIIWPLIQSVVICSREHNQYIYFFLDFHFTI